MPTPGEHKTVQARILAYAEAIGWTVVSREEAERRRAPSPEVYGGTGGDSSAAENIMSLSFFFDDLLDAKVREFNPRYAEATGALVGQFPPLLFRFGATSRHCSSDIHGNPPSPTGYVGTDRGKFFEPGRSAIATLMNRLSKE